MRLSCVAFAAAALMAGPVLAQTTAPAVPAPVPPAAPAAPAGEEAASPAEAAFQVKAQAFGEGVGAMAREMQAAIAAAGPDTAKRTADLDAIQARYQGQADAFADDLKTFVAAQAAAGDPEVDDEDDLEEGLEQIRSLPATMRAQIEQAAASAPAAAPAAPAAPATPPAN